MRNYNPEDIEPKWRKIWRKKKVFQPDLKLAKKPFYNLMMFPYPSGEGLHVGNMYAFTGSDIYGRFKRMQGFDIFEPIGLDGFGIHSENYAIKLGRHPAEVAKETEKNFYRQLEATGNAYAWENTLETYAPNYYRWTQWVFVQMFKHDLAYRKKSSVNWCPSCKTVLSDEQVISGQCERCSTETKQKELEQWFFKITDYAEKLLKNLECLPADAYGSNNPIDEKERQAGIDWSERVKVGQRNWIGKSEGAEILFSVVSKDLKIPVFTTRPDTLFGATFFVLAPESEWVKKLTTSKQQAVVLEYIKRSQSKTEIQRLYTEKGKSGAFTGSRVLNPATGEEIPVWIADYVVVGYGTGAIMGVPAHDQRDWEFAKRHGLEIREVISSGNVQEAAYDGEGKLVNSGQFNGLYSLKAIAKITFWLEKNNWGKKAVSYKLRDWCVSRQRYWGPPIPMINCSKCGWQPVPEKDLPVILPHLDEFQPKGLGESPLAQIEDWIKVPCPKCQGSARRETDVSDTFLDSSWYFFRYPSTRFTLSSSKGSGQVPFDPEITKKWLPVDMYIGGAEHTVLHLMYSRFITMAFKDFGLIDFEEPYKKFYAHGLITKDGAKMSKSKGNVVIPDEYIKKFGADTLRMYLMFLGPFSHGGDFTDAGIGGIRRFLNRVWSLMRDVRTKNSDNLDSDAIRITHQTIKKVTEDIETLSYNTAIAALMEYVNFLRREPGGVTRKTVETLLLLLAPLAPFITEELWQQISAHQSKNQRSSFDSIHLQPWPKYDLKLIKEEETTIVVQVNGKVRGQIKIKNEKLPARNATHSVAGGKMKNEVEKRAKKEPNVAKHLKGKKIKKTIFVPSRLINFVVS